MKNSLLEKELSKRAKRKKLELNPAFGVQNNFITDPARYVAAQCSRRAGKSNGLAYRFFRTMEKYPGSQCIYLALTRESAKDIMWPVLQEINDSYKLGCVFTESKLEMRHPNGSSLKLYGADMKNFVKRLRGRKYPGIAVDESQDFGMHLQALIDDVLTPSIADYKDGWIALTGTPGPVPIGYFFEVTHDNKYGYSNHKWTLLDNPYMPDPGAFIADLKERRGWDETHPTLLREWRNNWVLDTQSLWIRYKASTNHYASLPMLKWNYIMGIDLGFNDADAIAVIAWCEADPATYLVEECIHRKQGLTELVSQIEHLRKKYDVAKLVIDEGGLGKKLAEEMRRQHKIPVIGADKQRKQETVEFLNDALRLGRFKAKETSQFAQDSYLVQIDYDKTTPDKIVIKKQPHSDIIDAVIYAFKESPAYTYEKPTPKPKHGTPDWYQAEVDRMQEEAQEYFERQAEIKKDEDWL